MADCTTYETVIGLEVHVQLRTRTKLFCGCGTVFGEPPNTQTCPVCLGMPGALPVLNRTAFEYALKTALALGATIAAQTKFDRKNYYYPDLPKNYQISQYDMPFSTGGHVEMEQNGSVKTIGLTRIHLEEDAGKLIHEPARGVSYVDLNRTGTPLLEIVSEPDLRTPAQAGAYLRTLKHTIEYLEVSDCNMQEGSLRCDANVSLRPTGRQELGTKVEIKNMNSISGVEAALAYEVERQAAALAAGEPIVQETRLWDAERGVTASMRSKEGESDYRYFPEPDLPVVRVGREWVDRLRAALPELPRARHGRFQREYGLNGDDAGVLTAERPVADYYEAVVAAGAAANQAKNWVSQDVRKALNDRKIPIGRFKVNPRQLARLIGLIQVGTIDQSIARDEVFPAMVESGRDAQAIVEEQGLAMVSDTGAILETTRRVVEESPKPLRDVAKNPKAANKYIGLVRRAMGGKADVRVVREAIKRVIEEKTGQSIEF
jgi:aspartyl-tRNA(Asn)/glutamyl-tRNA(Gln) amidotransferase subunit B